MAGDFDGDTHPDLAVATYYSFSSSVTVLLNDGHGNFHRLAQFHFSNTAVTSLVAGDFTGDGHLDLVAANGRYITYPYNFGQPGDGAGWRRPGQFPDWRLLPCGESAECRRGGGLQRGQPTRPRRCQWGHLGCDHAAGHRDRQLLSSRAGSQSRAVHPADGGPYRGSAATRWS